MNYYPNYSPHPAQMPGMSSQPMPGYGTSNDELRSRLASMERDKHQDILQYSLDQY